MFPTKMQIDERQLRAVDELRSGSILCGGVGSGKSRTALLYYYTKVCHGEVALNGEGSWAEMKDPLDLYIITTAHKRDLKEWEHECSYFLIGETAINCGADWPAFVKIDSWNNIHKYKDVSNAFFIFDEQRVVGSGKWVRSFLKIAKSNKWILLSATPGDTWSDYIPVFIANGFYRNKTEFLSEHAVFNRFTTYPKIDRYVNCGKLIKYRRQIVVYMNYVSDHHPYHIYMMCKHQSDKYNAIYNARWNTYEGKPIETASELCYLLRRVVNEDRSRLFKILEVLRKHNKVIIFYNFDYERDMIKEFLEDHSILYTEWNGHVHQPILHHIDQWIYLVQYTAGAEGWECTTANTIIFYSQNYSYKTMVQAAGRIDRRNTEFDELYYYHLISDSSIDKAIQTALEHKETFNERTFGSQEKQGL